MRLYLDDGTFKSLAKLSVSVLPFSWPCFGTIRGFGEHQIRAIREDGIGRVVSKVIIST